MIAEKPKTEYELQEIDSSKASQSSSLFAGLSFPEVPKSRIVISKEKADVVPTATAGTTASAPELANPPISMEMEAALEACETTHLLGFSFDNQQQAPQKKEEVSNKTTSLRDLSALYAPLEVYTAPATQTMRSYPTLPDIERVSLPPPSSVSTNTVYGGLVHQPRQLAPPQVAHGSVNPAVESNLVQELLQENSRLTEEVAALKRKLTQQLPAQQQQQQSATQQQQTTSDTSSSSERVKYVCCGHCRQWLKAHGDAVLVRCTFCDAVNNCSLVPVTQSSTTVRILSY
eukprot:scaffold1537_cov162-Ochromonas_danica.AAC.28